MITKYHRGHYWHPASFAYRTYTGHPHTWQRRMSL
jgi:hypothetical protein